MPGGVNRSVSSLVDRPWRRHPDGLDRLKTTQTGPASTLVTFTYDSLGRRIKLEEMDSGTWKWAYDDADNLFYQDDPNPNQHLEFCYDALNRRTRKAAFTTDGKSADPCTAGTTRTTYGYDTCPVGVGRLCSESAPNRYSRSFEYSARGLKLAEDTTITAGAHQASWTQHINYDEADRIATIAYPTDVDNTFEIFSNGYNAAGQLLYATTPGNSYLVNATYDRFGRPKLYDMGGGVVHEQRDYFGQTENYRLKQIAVFAGTPRQTWDYGTVNGSSITNGYDRAGNLLKIDDVTPTSGYAGSDRENDWTYTYFGVGRLKSANWAQRAWTPTYQYDSMGNMTQGNLAFPGILSTTQVTFTHDTQRPHHLSAMTPGGGSPAIAYEPSGTTNDGNGGLMGRPATVGSDMGKTITYDVEGRVQTVTANGTVVESVYDDAGMRIARIVNSSDVSFYFGKTVEVHNGDLIRHFYANGRRIAFSVIAAPPQLTLAALADDHPSVLLARAAPDARWLTSLPPLGPDIGPAAGAAGCVVLIAGTFILCLLPMRARLGPARSVRRGRVAALIVLYVVTLPAWPPARNAVRQSGTALAQCAPPPAYPAYLVHVDHLGSTTLLTAYKQSGLNDGDVVEYYRYGAYGQMQAYDRTPNGAAVPSGSEKTDLTYTGQRWDAAARLYYYGARFYDPMIAQFMALDPAREYASPYAYVRGNPIVLVDPTGQISAATAGLALAIALQQGTLGSGNSLFELYQRSGMIQGGAEALGNYLGASFADATGHGSLAKTVASVGLLATASVAHEQGAGAAMTPGGVMSPGMSQYQGDIMPPIPISMQIRGYIDVSIAIPLGSIRGIPVGVSLGVQVDVANLENQHAYIAPGVFITGPSVGGSITASPNLINVGVSAAVQGTTPPVLGGVGLTVQVGFGIAGSAPGWFFEGGIGLPPGIMASVPIVFGPNSFHSVQSAISAIIGE